MKSKQFCIICGEFSGDMPRASRIVRRAQARLVRTGRGVARYVGVVRRALMRVGRTATRALQRVLDLVGPTFAFAFLAILGSELLTAVILFDHGAGAELIVLVSGGVGIVSSEVAVRLDRINRGGPGAGAMVPASA